MTLEQLAGMALTFVLGGGFAAVTAKRMSKDMAVVGAETRVIELLREEVERLSNQVGVLSEKVEALTAENHALREQLLKGGG